MEFERSTQAKSWMFDVESLLECKRRAAIPQSDEDSSGSNPRVRKFASGFCQRDKNDSDSRNTSTNNSNNYKTTSRKDNFHFRPVQYENHYNSPLLIPPLLHTSSSAPVLTPNDQDSLVHFHAHQIQRLMGPNAIFPQLRRSASVLSTAIMLFRRFYLSNSVIDFHPRNMAVASALLAVKADCEAKLEIGLLAYATSVVNQKASKAPLCRDELRAVSIEEIEESERALLRGLDYQLRCHHPFGAIRVLTSDLANYLASSGEHNHSKRTAFQYGYRSPTSVQDCYSEERVASLCERAIAVAQSALVYSDVNFLFPPGQIAFAAVAVALEGNDYGGRLGAAMRSYLRMRFPQKTDDELCDFEFEVTNIICNLANCPEIDLDKFCSNPSRSHRGSRRCAQYRADNVHRVFAVAAGIRYRRSFDRRVLPTQMMAPRSSLKRSRDRSASPRLSFSKIAKVTPIHTPYF